MPQDTLPALLSSVAGTIERTWPVLAFLCLVTVVAELADEAGLFDVTGHWAARFARGSAPRLLALVCLLATVTTIGLSLDTTVVLVTPVALVLADELDLPVMPFALACVWLANGASLLLPVSNLTNLLAQDRLALSTHDFAAATALPQAAALLATLVALAVRSRALVGRTYVVPTALPPHDPWLVAAAALAAGVVAVGALAGLPAWCAAALALALLVVAHGARRPERLDGRRLLRLVPWRTAAQTLALFLVVGIAQPWLREVVQPLVGGPAATPGSTAAAGLTAAVTANLVNNLPAYLLLESAASNTAHLLAVLVGVGVGPQVLLWGSVANLLWRDRLRARGVTVTDIAFAREGWLLVPLVVGSALAALCWTVAPG